MPSTGLVSLDIAVVVIFIAAVLVIGLWKSWGTKSTAEDYFLAGRGLTWPVIGISLIAANISAEQMVGMAGGAANFEIGMAIASYEWMAAITLVLVAFFFLPSFLRAGIFTVPQYLENRYNVLARSVMSLLVVVVLVVVNTSTVTYLGARFFEPYFPQLGIAGLSWVIGIAAAVYITIGGLKASAWADLIQGTALIVGGAVVTWLAMTALGDPASVAETGANSAEQIAATLKTAPGAAMGEQLAAIKREGMDMFLPAQNSVLPWTAFLLGGWIPHFYYWGLNQYIMQRALGSKSLADGQKGIVFAAALKLIIPFFIVFPGLLAFLLYSGKMGQSIDTRANNAVVETFDQLTAGGQPAAAAKVFPFDGDFADRRMADAERMFAYHIAASGADADQLKATASSKLDPADGKPKTAGEVLAEANDAAIKAIVAAAPLTETAQVLRGYEYDEAFPQLVANLAKPGIKGFIVAAVLGAVVSSLASMLNAASTVFTVDIYGKFIKKNASQGSLVAVGRVTVVVATLIACFVAPAIEQFQGAFNFIQEFQGFISPGILTIFLFGFFVPRAPRMCGWVGLVLSPIVYGGLKVLVDQSHFATGSVGDLVLGSFLNRMGITIAVISTVLAVLTAVKPLKEPVTMPAPANLDLRSSGVAKVGGVIVIALTVGLYLFFRGE